MTPWKKRPKRRSREVAHTKGDGGLCEGYGEEGSRGGPKRAEGGRQGENESRGQAQTKDINHENECRVSEGTGDIVEGDDSERNREKRDLKDWDALQKAVRIEDGDEIV